MMMASSQISDGLTESHGSTVRSGSSGSARNVMASRISAERISSQVSCRSHWWSGRFSARMRVTTTPAAIAT